ncbi:DUF4870 domain-containing protein [Thermoactinomyces mirandus]|uniref:DUF4870 domain-containing protein n=1 Tax=Thermoactinomyces mirandus TaxID=2756294 RepID=A0A7W1XSQ1_9BACL|nr:DUF4870 domain-containing protein [Thermoactinomyces mirandus]MBA4602491.1 DUF4870 domain-containing protein [Thermoactinomyces mirandus]
MDTKWIKILTHASIWFAPILVPVLVYLLASDRELKRLSLQAMIFHIVMASLIWISSVFAWVLIGIPFVIVFGVIAFVTPVLGIARALLERPFNYPVIRRWV